MYAGGVRWGAFAAAATVLWLAPVAAAAPAAVPPPRPRIVNGVPAAAHPAVGALLWGSDPDSAQLACTGTLIGCRTFLTAAHCLEGGSNPEWYHVYFRHFGTVPVAAVRSHPGYRFPDADIAVVELARTPTGIVPLAIETEAPPPEGTPGRIVGFGRTGGDALDYGILREGEVVLGPCPPEAAPSGSLCWTFTEPVGMPGTDSNTCQGDSGGPLLIGAPGGWKVAGVTSGGTSDDCLPPDQSYDTDVSFHAEWIAFAAREPLGPSACGAPGMVMDTLAAVDGFLQQTDGGFAFSLQLPPGLSELRVTLNGADEYPADFDLYLRAGNPPTALEYDCAGAGRGQFAACRIADPAAGPWHVRVDRITGSGPFQATASVFAADCSAAPDGTACEDANPCTAGDRCLAGTCTGTPVADGTPCDDGESCTDTDVCTAGTCAGTPLPDGAPCEDGSGCTRGDACAQGHCAPGPAPALSCRLPQRSGAAVLRLRDRAGQDRDRLVWKWRRGDAVAGEEFGNPAADGPYSLCVYQESASGPQRVLEYVAPAGPAWRTARGGWRYRAASGAVRKLRLRAGDAGRATAVFVGAGPDLFLPPLPGLAGGPLLVQLVGPDLCMEARFAAPLSLSAERLDAHSE